MPNRFWDRAIWAELHSLADFQTTFPCLPIHIKLTKFGVACQLPRGIYFCMAWSPKTHIKSFATLLTKEMPSVPAPSKAGIIETNTGERHIPSSTRPDGSKRKEIKIRPGYKPPEDVEVYKNRTADAFKNRGSGGVPGAERLQEDKDEGSAASNKNAKRREARKKAKAAEETGDKPKEESNGVGAKEQTEEEEDPEVIRQRKARGLKKKLKQAKELQEKKEGGAALLPDQFQKVIKINELIRELDALGFNAEGEPKEKKEEPISEA